MRRTISRPAPSPVPKTPPCVSSIKGGSVSPPPPTGKLWISWQPTSSSQRLMATNRCSLFPIQNRPSQSRPMTKPSLALSKESETLDFDVPGELRFIRNSSIFGKMSTAVCRANEKPEPDGLWFDFSSGEWIRTTDLRVMRVEPEIVTFVLRSRPFYEHCVRWFR